MKKQFSIAEARNQLPALVHDAERGAAVELTRRGRPVAVLVSAREYERLTQAPGFWAALETYRAEHHLVDDDDAFEDVRDRGPGRPVKW